MAKKNDIVFLGIASALIFAGFFILSSASLGLAAKPDKDYYYPLLKQVLLGGGLGFFLFFITSHIYYKKWQKLALPLFLFSFVLTFFVLAPGLGFSHGGASRWLSLGPLTFQPSELLKFAFIVYLSSWLAKRKNEIGSFKSGLLPFLIITGLVAIALVLQPDIGTLGVISISSAFLFFLAGGRIAQIGLLATLGIALLIVMIQVEPDGYMMKRIQVFQNSSYDLRGAGYQLDQAKISLGSGGLFGRGFGQGLSKFNNLPEPMGDSIFAIVGEEFGFIGTSILVILFFLFFYKIMRIAFRIPDAFGRLLVSGIAILIIVQSFINMYAMAGLVPLTGLPLVFISQGGSALVLVFAELGVVLNASKHG